MNTNYTIAHDQLVESGEVEKGKLDVVGISCDVSSEKSVQDAFGNVLSRWGRVDSVVASAGESEHIHELNKGDAC